MTDTQGAAKAALANKQDVEQEISWLGARLREKSTYAGLTVIVSMALPFVAKYVPVLGDANAASIVNDISMVGVGIGGLIGVFCKEKGSAAIVLLALALGTLAMPLSAQAQPKHLAPPRPAAAASQQSQQQMTAQQIQRDPLAFLRQFSIKDIQNAILLAQAQNPPDTTALQCWNGLLPIVQNLSLISAQNGGTATPATATPASSSSTTSATSSSASSSATPVTPAPIGNPLQPGAATFVQDARDAAALAQSLQSANGPLATLNQACAPLVVSINTTLTLLGIQGGIAIAGGPAAAGAGGVAATGVVAALQQLLANLPFKP